MDEMFIFIKILSMLKKFWVWSCIYQDRNEQWTKYEFFLNTKSIEKVLRLTQYLPR